MNQVLALHINKHEGHYRIQLENLSDHVLEGLEILSVFPQGYNVEMMIKFEVLDSLDPHSTATVAHKVLIPMDGEWVADDFITDDMLMCLTEKYSKGETHDIHVSWSVNGEHANETLMAGAGSGL